LSNEDVIKMANIFCEDATAAEVYIKIADGLHEGERLWVQRQLESTGAWGRAIRNLMYRKVTSINTTWNQSIAITSECVCDIIQRCIESLLTGFKPVERTDRMHSVCEMRCYHARDMTETKLNKIPTRSIS